MYAVGRLGSYISRGVCMFSGPFHPFGGAVDIIVVEQPDGTFKSSPWCVQFGKFQGVLKAREKIVSIWVNGVEADFHMYLNPRGEAYFLREDDGEEGDVVSSSSFSCDEIDPPSSRSCIEECAESATCNGETHSMTNSGGSRILGLVFGRRSVREDTYREGDDGVCSSNHTEIASNLLEVNWTNNLATTDPDERNVSSISATNILDEERNNGRTNILENGFADSLMDDADEPRNDLDLRHEEIGSCMVEVNHIDASRLSITESLSEFESSMIELEESQGSDGVVKSNFGIYEGKVCSDGFESLIYCETSGTCRIGISGSIDEAHTTPCLPRDAEHRQLHYHAETLCSTTDLITQGCSHQSVDTKLEASDGCFSQKDSSSSCVQANGEVNVEVSSMVSTSATQVLAVDLLFDPIKDFKSSEGASLAENLEEEQFFICELDPSNSLPREDDQTPNNFMVKSHPIDIPKVRKSHPQVGRLAVSLPDMWGDDGVGAGYLHHRLSLDSKPATLDWPLRQNGKNLNADDSAARSPQQRSTNGDDLISEDLKNAVSAADLTENVVAEPIVTSSASWRIWPFSFRRMRPRKIMPQAEEVGTKTCADEIVLERNDGADREKYVPKTNAIKGMVYAFAPTSKQLASLDLKEGMNVVAFTFSTAMLGEQKVDARIFLWKWNTRIVVSDVDGTITKSDVLGQFMPLVGVDWSQMGVAHLFSAIKDNGYQLLFLSARAISQAYYTRQFLINLKQDGKALPDGPVVISPDGLFPSLVREVIRRAPHEFKIACLEDIRALFPSDCNPFYAGFGNRVTDELSYLKVGIPRGKIFIINPKGEVAMNRGIDTRSYSSLHALVHDMFPPMTSFEEEDFNSWNYWKLTPVAVDI